MLHTEVGLDGVSAVLLTRWTVPETMEWPLRILQAREMPCQQRGYVVDSAEVEAVRCNYTALNRPWSRYRVDFIHIAGTY